MALAIPRPLVELILLGPQDDRRQLQDSPILADVWIAFAKNPDRRQELLITPYMERPAGAVAYRLSQSLSTKHHDHQAAVAYLQGIVAAKLSFVEMLSCVVPMTHWWSGKRVARAIGECSSSPEAIQQSVRDLLDAAAGWQSNDKRAPAQNIETPKRYVALAGLILWAEHQEADEDWAELPPQKQIARIVNTLRLERPIAAEVSELYGTRLPEGQQGLVWHVTLNRRATSALSKSVPAVKADAARNLFDVDCSQIVWAVIDSGIDAMHPAFRDKDQKNKVRVLRTFDFTTIRDIVSLDNLHDRERRRRRGKRLLRHGLKIAPALAEVERYLKALAAEAERGRPINWEMVERLVEVEAQTPNSSHGTHVAGILGAAKEPAVEALRAAGDEDDEDCADGMCPDIRLYDFRVLAPTLPETEFAIIAALQFIRYINERNSYMTIHGANLSLSILHDVRNFACGRTPVCNECERLVNSGVVVVAAAGNRGYHSFATEDGLYQGYAAFSVTDPGNADGVITVGATHRYWPHTYGVSFFSSRGPTGDGRLKPDLVAPGERIRAPLPNNSWGDQDGTSMAAPHVSGAAAMLMARYSELIGQPRRIKQILCDSATDLGRERTFQGHGMLDVLRALQSV